MGRMDLPTWLTTMLAVGLGIVSASIPALVVTALAVRRRKHAATPAADRTDPAGASAGSEPPIVDRPRR